MVAPGSDPSSPAVSIYRPGLFNVLSACLWSTNPMALLLMSHLAVRQLRPGGTWLTGSRTWFHRKSSSLLAGLTYTTAPSICDGLWGRIALVGYGEKGVRKGKI